MFFVTTPLKLYHCKIHPCVIPSKLYVTIPLCSYVTMSSKPISLKNMSLILSKPYVTIPLCSSVILSSKLMSLKNYVFLALCLSIPCSSVLYKSPTPLAGGEAVPRERENQINTLVLKDINFTINIIELSYYRTIDTLNQPKSAPVV